MLVWSLAPLLESRLLRQQ